MVKCRRNVNFEKIDIKPPTGKKDFDYGEE